MRWPVPTWNLRHSGANRCKRQASCHASYRSNKRQPLGVRIEELHMLMRDAEMALMECRVEQEHRYFRNLMDRLHRTRVLLEQEEL